jgi:hypothetical protein
MSNTQWNILEISEADIGGMANQMQKDDNNSTTGDKCSNSQNITYDP